MATKKETAKKTVKKSSNPVGRPRKKYGAETLMDNKKSFKVNNNIVFDKYADALILMAVILIVACIVLYLAVK